MQRSITTVSPPAAARAAASSLEMPSCNQRPGPNLHRFVGNGGRCFGPAKDIDDVDLLGDGFE